MTELEALEAAITIANGPTALARLITDLARKEGAISSNKQVTQQNISNWRHREKRCAAKFARFASLVVGGQVSPHQLRPDLYPKESLPQTT